MPAADEALAQKAPRRAILKSQTILWKAPLGPMCDFLKHPNLKQEISAEAACPTGYKPRAANYGLSVIVEETASETARALLLDGMSKPEICRKGFRSAARCLTFGRRLAKDIIRVKNTESVEVKCARRADASDQRRLYRRLENGKILETKSPFRFLGRTRF